MTQEILKNIEELFSSPDKLTPGNLEKLLFETFKVFNELKTKLGSQDKAEHESALELANALKETLQQQAKALCESAGLDPSIVETYLHNPSNFTPEQWKAIEEMKAEMQNYQAAFSKTTEPKASTEPKRKPKAVKQWIVG